MVSWINCAGDFNNKHSTSGVCVCVCTCAMEKVGNELKVCEKRLRERWSVITVYLHVIDCVLAIIFVCKMVGVLATVASDIQICELAVSTN